MYQEGSTGFVCGEQSGDLALEYSKYSNARQHHCRTKSSSLSSSDWTILSPLLHALLFCASLWLLVQLEPSPNALPRVAYRRLRGGPSQTFFSRVPSLLTDLVLAVFNHLDPRWLHRILKSRTLLPSSSEADY